MDRMGVADVHQADLYQEIGTGTLFTVLDVTEDAVRLRQADPPYGELEVAPERFLERYAVADSA
jgi:hypothetical protein